MHIAPIDYYGYVMLVVYKLIRMSLIPDPMRWVLTTPDNKGSEGVCVFVLDQCNLCLALLQL